MDVRLAYAGFWLQSDGKLPRSKCGANLVECGNSDEEEADDA
jgi:hypothetical protein